MNTSVALRSGLFLTTSPLAFDVNKRYALGGRRGSFGSRTRLPLSCDVGWAGGCAVPDGEVVDDVCDVASCGIMYSRSLHATDAECNASESWRKAVESVVIVSCDVIFG